MSRFTFFYRLMAAHSAETTSVVHSLSAVVSTIANPLEPDDAVQPDDLDGAGDVKGRPVRRPSSGPGGVQVAGQPSLRLVQYV